MCFRLQVCWTHRASLLRTALLIRLQLKKTLEAKSIFHSLQKNPFHNSCKWSGGISVTARDSMKHTRSHTKVFPLMDRHQIWIRDTVAGFICHLKESFNVVLQSDETQILITKRGNLGLCGSVPLNTDVIRRGGGSSEWKGYNDFSS